MKARHIFSELDLIYTNCNLLEDAMHKVDDATVVGSASKINMLREQFMVLDLMVLLMEMILFLVVTVTTLFMVMEETTQLMVVQEMILSLPVQVMTL